MTRAFALGLLLLGQMLLQPTLAHAKPKRVKPAKKEPVAAAPRMPVAQATDDEAPGSRQEKAPKKK